MSHTAPSSETATQNAPATPLEEPSDTTKGPLEMCENLAFAWFAKEGAGVVNSMKLSEGARRCLDTYDAPARARYCSRIASGRLMREDGEDVHAIRYVLAAMRSACGR